MCAATREVVLDGKPVAVDSCIADVVVALNRGGVPTVGSCCGHETYDGFVQLADGRLLLIRRMPE